VATIRPAEKTTAPAEARRIARTQRLGWEALRIAPRGLVTALDAVIVSNVEGGMLVLRSKDDHETDPGRGIVRCSKLKMHLDVGQSVLRYFKFLSGEVCDLVTGSPAHVLQPSIVPIDAGKRASDSVCLARVR
jgi:hypothetical protein